MSSDQVQLHEIQEVLALKRFIAHFRVDCIFDVGANVGQYGRLLRDKVGYPGMILSFEPFPAAFSELSKNASSDPLWAVFDFALSERSGPTRFNVVSSSQMNSIEEPTTEETDAVTAFNTKSGEIEIQAMRLDDIFSEFRRQIGFSRPLLKLDTQGHDLKVCAGMTDLTVFAGIQTEIAFKRAYKDTPDFRQSIAYFEERGFEMCAIFPNNQGHFPYLVEQDLLLFNSAFLPAAPERVS